MIWNGDFLLKFTLLVTTARRISRIIINGARHFAEDVYFGGWGMATFYVFLKVRLAFVMSDACLGVGAFLSYGGLSEYAEGGFNAYKGTTISFGCEGNKGLSYSRSPSTNNATSVL